MKFCIKSDSMGVVMETLNIPPGKSSSQVQAVDIS
jgi:hypothetical protein